MKPLTSSSLAQATKTVILLNQLLAGASIRGTVPSFLTQKKAA